MEAITVPHLPNFQLIRDHLDKIAPVRLVQLNFFAVLQANTKRFLEGKNPNIFNPAFAGGALMDINYYNLRFMLDLFGEPENVRYFANLAHNGIDTSGVLIMTYPGFLAEAVGAKAAAARTWCKSRGKRVISKCPKKASRCISVTVITQNGEENIQ